MFSLIPKEEKFFDMFTEVAENIRESAILLEKMLQANADFRDLAESIKSREHKGDRLTHELITKLNKTFIVPIDREDIYSLSSTIDDVLDVIESVARRLVLFKIQRIGEASSLLSHLLVRSTTEIVSAITELRNGMKVLNHCIEINRLEEEADHIYHEALAELFEFETDPINLIKRKELLETLETALDKCEDVANVIEGIVVKNA